MVMGHILDIYLIFIYLQIFFQARPEKSQLDEKVVNPYKSIINLYANFFVHVFFLFNKQKIKKKKIGYPYIKAERQSPDIPSCML